MTEGPSPNDLRRRLAAGSVIGTFLKVPSPEVVDLAKLAGFDLAVIDLEHSQLSERKARLLVRHAFDIGFPVVVRVPSVDRGQINRLLEAGASGIQLSTTRSRHQIDELAAATRYAPDGDRSISLSHVRAGFGATSLAEFISSQSNEPPLIVGQIETATTDDPLDTILRPPLDVTFIGTADLSVSVGAPGDLNDQKVRARMDEIGKAASANDVILGGYGGNQATIDLLIGLGARYLMVGSDLGALSATFRETVTRTRHIIQESNESEPGEE